MQICKVSLFGHGAPLSENIADRQEEKLKDCLIYKMEHLIDIPVDHYSIRSSGKHENQFLQIRHSANIFGNNIFPTTKKEWNYLPPSTVSSKSQNSFQNNLIHNFSNIKSYEPPCTLA